MILQLIFASIALIILTITIQHLNVFNANSHPISMVLHVSHVNILISGTTSLENALFVLQEPITTLMRNLASIAQQTHILIPI